MTLAEKFRDTRQATWANPKEFMDFVLALDPNSHVQARRGGGVWVIFSDGSEHRIGGPDAKIH